MIAFLKGDIVDIAESKVILEVNGIGYNVFVTGRDTQRLSGERDQVKIHTYLQVREDSMQLFGFLEREDLEVFQLLLGVNGVGPKAALGILSVFSPSDLRFAVLAGDYKTLSKAPGIGTKTAQKMILELKDKFDLMEAFEEKLSATQGSQELPGDKNGQSEAVQALTALGYPAAQALKAVRSVEDAGGMTTEDILKAALKKMSF